MTSAPPNRRVVLIFVLAALLALALAGSVFYFFFWAPATRSASPASGPRSLAVTLYFLSPVAVKTSTRAFQLPEHLAFPEQVRAILEKMVEKNPDPEATLWPATLRFHNVFLRNDGLLILDLEQGVTYNHASAASEWCIVRSLTATLLANYSNVKAVKFLVNGGEQDTLSGHVSLSSPFNSQDLEP